MDLTTLLVSQGGAVIAAVAATRATMRWYDRRLSELERFNKDLPKNYVPREVIELKLENIEKTTRHTHAFVEAMLMGGDRKLSIKSIEAAADAAYAGLNDWIDQYINGPCQKFEGNVPWMYLDTEGFVTVGTGNMLPTVESAQMLPFRDAKGALATAQAIADEYRRVRAQPAGHKAEFYRCATSPTLREIDSLTLLRKRCNSFVEELRDTFPGFDAFPLNAKLALLDMIYNMGLGIAPASNRTGKGLLGFSRMCVAVRVGNFTVAANECDREKGDPAFMNRNVWTRAHFLIAAQEVA